MKDVVAFFIAAVLLVLGWRMFDYLERRNPQPVVIYPTQPAPVVEPMFFPTAVIPVVPTWTYPPPVNVMASPVVEVIGLPPVTATPEFQRDGLIGGVATGVVGEHDPGDGHHRSTAAP
jgi:hypothetical protein